MTQLTDTLVRNAMERVGRSGGSELLTEGEGRGTGRLVIRVKATRCRVVAEWLAQQWRDNKRVRVKIGDYPSMTVEEARETFERDFANAIQKRRSIRIVRDKRTGTVADLFDGYVGWLKAQDKPSWKEAEKNLSKIADTLGRRRAARDIEPEEITEILRPIYRRGARSMACHVRGYLQAAFNWGIKSEHDYRHQAPRRFGLHVNPAATIPTEPKVVGNRWLTAREFVKLYRWLESPSVQVHPPYLRAVRLLMLTGQRVQEVARLHVDQWDADESIIDWSKTKNGSPHAVPVPSIAAELIESITPNRHGYFFPAARDPTRPVSHQTLYAFMWRQRQNGVIPLVTNRDLRRTWKTLAGQAGVSKEVRDRLQNHALQDVSSRNYDRWDYMPEKRAGMEKWDGFVRSLLAKEALRRGA